MGDSHLSSKVVQGSFNILMILSFSFLYNKFVRMILQNQILKKNKLFFYLEN